MPILEAMACGVPVACSNAASLPEVAGDGAAYFDPGDEKAIAETLRTTLTDASIRAHLIEKGRARVSGFSWTDATERTLNELLAASGKQP